MSLDMHHTNSISSTIVDNITTITGVDETTRNDSEESRETRTIAIEPAVITFSNAGEPIIPPDFFNRYTVEQATNLFQGLSRLYQSYQIEQGGNIGEEDTGMDVNQEAIHSVTRRNKTHNPLRVYRRKWQIREWETQLDMFNDFPYNGRGKKLSASIWDFLLEWVYEALTAINISELQAIFEQGRGGAKLIQAGIKQTESDHEELSEEEEMCLYTVKRLSKLNIITTVNGLRRRLLTLDLSEQQEALIDHMLESSPSPKRRRNNQDNNSSRSTQLIGNVNERILELFSESTKRTNLNIQHIKDWLKEGNKWKELCTDPETTAFALGIIVLLPISGRSTFFRKMNPPSWSFFLSKLSTISPRFIQLSRVLTPAVKCFRETGQISTDWGTWEILENTNLNISDTFESYLHFHPGLSLKDGLQMIHRHGRISSNLERIPPAVTFDDLPEDTDQEEDGSQSKE